MKNALFFLLISSFLSISSQALELSEGVEVSSIGASQGSQLNYELHVPDGATNIKIEMWGGTGDADLYVRAGAVPTSSRYDCRPYRTGNTENCFFSSPSSSIYYIQLRAYSTFSNVSLLATYDESQTDMDVLDDGQTLFGLAAGQGSSRYFEINVPSGSTQLTVAMSGGTGDADLYVRADAQPTQSSYDCRPYIGGNDELCTLNNLQAGNYYVLIYGYSSYSNVSLSANIEGGNGDDGSGDDGPGDGTDGATWDGFENYYSDAIGKTGQNLLAALNEAAARNHSRMSYSQVWTALKYTDEDPNNSNNVILIYTGRSQSKSFTSSGNNDPDAWNREHSWPKSHGFPSSGQWAYTDIHHLRPSDASVNSTRGNKDFDNGGSQISEAPGNYTDSDSIQPRDDIKGDMARMMFYMDIRYNGNDSTGVPDLKLVNYTNSSGATLGKLCTLLAWHNQDPVSNAEIARHARIVEQQGNRNPFVDYPTWANQIWESECN
ncbi:endonuclease [Pleionea sediminis]|uniref:endonuclease n=1 Tax=Pleionea sediminis TaxID=2569479 RepID=UPI001184D4E2|nr:endonuclease [Pleionea sediminis]